MGAAIERVETQRLGMSDLSRHGIFAKPMRVTPLPGKGQFLLWRRWVMAPVKQVSADAPYWLRGIKRRMDELGNGFT